MQPSDRENFARILAEVMAYYGKEGSPFLLDVFWTSLKGHEFEDVSRAFTLHARDPDRGQFAPRVADITRLLEGSTSTQGMRAWAKVEQAVKSVGKYRSVTFDDPLIHVVVTEMGGWTNLCCSSIDELPFKARDFERRYAAYRLRRELPGFSPYLIGQHEADNRLNGHEREVRPVLIGDPERASRVFERGTQQPALRITQAGDLAQKLIGAIAKREDAA